MPFSYNQDQPNFNSNDIDKFKPLVVLVDDDPDIVELFAESLGVADIQVIVFDDGEYVVNSVAKLVESGITPKLIMLDMMLRKVNGPQVLEQLHQNEKTKDISTVILSNLSDEKEEERCRKMGALDCWLKIELTPGKFVQRVKNIISE